MKSLNLHLAASKDDLRPQMQYIAIQSKEKVCVTDANILIWGTFEDLFLLSDLDETINNLLDSGIYIHKDEYKKIANKDLLTISDVDQERKELRFMDVKLNQYVVGYETDVDYINWESVIPTSMEEINSILLNMELMNRLYSVCKPRDTKLCKFDLQFHGQTRAIKLKGAFDSTFGINALIMPMMKDS